MMMTNRLILKPLKMSRIRKTLFVLCLFIAGCAEEEISLELENAEMPYQIVVHGGVYSIYGKQFIKLTKPVASTDKRKYPRVREAKIEVTDGQNTYQYYETDEPGEYKSIDKFAGEVGKVYTLKIEYEGKTYFASDSMVATDEITLDEFPVDEIKYTQFDHYVFDTVINDYTDSVETMKRIDFHMSEHYFGSSKATIWMAWGSGRSKNLIPPPKWIVMGDKYFSHKGTPPQGVYPMGTRSSGFGCELGDSLELIKITMSDSYYNYHISRFNLTDWYGGIFSTIPGNVKTNLSKGATGYFCACDVKIRFYTYDELFEYVKKNESDEDDDD